MRKILLLITFLLVIKSAVGQETRGTWLARDAFVSKENIAKVMDSLAANNFNVVYVNCWSRGYPLWKSQVFKNECGVYIDPQYTNRDILAEAIAEGHRAGLHVEAWFEYGFVGGWTGNNPPGGKGPIFVKYPQWVAKTQDGTEMDGSNFYWMAQANPDAQNFLISLCTEVARNYDIDGIELDRIRYSSLNYGYDSVTVALYKLEHGGSTPPSLVNDTTWLRWRANKLNMFMARAYDSIKTINQHINVSNAPSLYSSNSYTSYLSFAQDWYWWVNNNKVDNVQVQSYVGNSAAFGNILDYIKTVVNFNKVFPAFAISPNGTPINNADLKNFVTLTRQKGFKGNAIWYYTDLVQVFPYFKANIFTTKQEVSYSPLGWRGIKDITTLQNAAKIVKTGTWVPSNVIGYTGQSIYALNNSPASIDYYCSVPNDGTYEVYAYVITGSNRTPNGEYKVFDTTGTITINIDQTNSDLKRWYKLGDFKLKAGEQKVLSITNNGITDTSKVVGADAMMIILNRKLSPDVVNSLKIKESIKKKFSLVFNLKSYPNPFNNQFQLIYNLTDIKPCKITLYNTLGKAIISWMKFPNSIGEQTEFINLNKYNLASGAYFINVTQEAKSETIKIILAK